MNTFYSLILSWFKENKRDLPWRGNVLSAALTSDTVDNIEISPLPIKKPTRKCKQWELNENVKNNLVDLFV